jgi:hypothetical protein
MKSRFMKYYFLSVFLAGFQALIVLFGHNNVYAQASTVRDTAEAIPVVLSVRGVGTAEFVALSRDRKIYLPMIATFKFLRIGGDYNPQTGVVEGFFLSSDNKYRVDPQSNTISFRDSTKSFFSDDYIRRSEDFYLRQELYGPFFGMELKYYRSTLTVTLRTNLRLPIYLERQREAARKRQLSLLGVHPQAEMNIPSSNPAIGGGRLDWNLSAFSSTKGRPTYRYDFNLGERFLGGDHETRVRGTIRQPLRIEDVTTRLQYAFLDHSLVRQVVLGDMLSTGLRPTSIFGVEITNRPAARRLLFTEELFSGYIGMNQTVDFYKGVILTENQPATGEGQYRFSNLLPYGVSNFTVKGYDQFGIERTVEYRIVVPPEMIPPGQVEYSLIGGILRPWSDRPWANDVNGNFALRWGVNSRMTIGGGVDYTESFLSRFKFHPSINAIVRLSDIASCSFTGAPSAYSKAEISAVYPSTLGGSLGYSYFARNPFYNLRNAIDEKTLTINVPFTLSGKPMAFTIFGRQSELRNGREWGTNGTLSGVIGLVSYRLFESLLWAEDSFNPRRLVTHQTQAVVGTALPSALFFRGITTYDHLFHRFLELRLSLSRSVQRSLYVNFFVDRSFLVYTTTIGLQLTYYFPFSIFRASVTRSGSEGTYGFSENVSGSLSYVGETHRFVFDYLNTVGTGGLILNPFVDLNGNGIMDPGEEQIRDARVSSGIGGLSSRLRYESGVGYRLNRTLPYEQYILAIDPVSLQNPLWVPRFATMSVISEPDQFRVVNLPIVVGGAVRGAVQGMVEGAPLRPIEGINVKIQSEEEIQGKPKFEKIEITFSTGEYEFIAIPPGRYIISIDEDQVARLGYVTEKSRSSVEISAKPEGDEVNGINFLLK